MALSTSVWRIEAVVDFPCLRRSLVDGRVVLFSGLREGMVLHSGNHPSSDAVGCYSATWPPATDTNAWEPIKSITIEEV